MIGNQQEGITAQPPIRIMTDTMVSVQSATSVITIILPSYDSIHCNQRIEHGQNAKCFQTKNLLKQTSAQVTTKKGISNLGRIVNSARTVGVTVKVGRLLLSQVRLHMNRYCYIFEKFKSKD